MNFSSKKFNTIKKYNKKLDINTKLNNINNTYNKNILFIKGIYDKKFINFKNKLFKIKENILNLNKLYKIKILKVQSNNKFNNYIELLNKIDKNKLKNIKKINFKVENIIKRNIYVKNIVKNLILYCCNQFNLINRNKKKLKIEIYNTFSIIKKRVNNIKDYNGFNLVNLNINSYKNLKIKNFSQLNYNIKNIKKFSLILSMHNTYNLYNKIYYNLSICKSLNQFYFNNCKYNKLDLYSNLNGFYFNNLLNKDNINFNLEINKYKLIIGYMYNKNYKLNIKYNNLKSYSKITENKLDNQKEISNSILFSGKIISLDYSKSEVEIKLEKQNSKIYELKLKNQRLIEEINLINKKSNFNNYRFNEILQLFIFIKQQFFPNININLQKLNNKNSFIEFINSLNNEFKKILLNNSFKEKSYIQYLLYKLDRQKLKIINKKEIINAQKGEIDILLEQLYITKAIKNIFLELIRLYNTRNNSIKFYTNLKELLILLNFSNEENLEISKLLN